MSKYIKRITTGKKTNIGNDVEDAVENFMGSEKRYSYKSCDDVYSELTNIFLDSFDRKI